MKFTRLAVCNLRYVLITVFAICFATHAPAQDVVSEAVRACAATYGDATRNKSFSSTSYEQLNTIFDKYCSASGELSSSSSSVNFAIPVENVPVKFGGSGNNAKERMQRFCRNYSSVYYEQNSASKGFDTVVVEALRSFNNCIEIARKTNDKLIVTSTTSADNSTVAINFDLRDDALQVRLGAVSYNHNEVVCWSNTLSVSERQSEAQSEMNIHAAAGTDPLNVVDANTSVAAHADFDVFCRAKLQEYSDGTIVRPDASILLSVVGGPSNVAYTAFLPGETILPIRAAEQINEKLSVIETAVEHLQGLPPPVIWETLEKSKSYYPHGALWKRGTKVDYFDFTFRQSYANNPTVIPVFTDQVVNTTTRHDDDFNVRMKIIEITPTSAKIQVESDGGTHIARLGIRILVLGAPAG